MNMAVTDKNQKVFSIFFPKLKKKGPHQ